MKRLHLLFPIPRPVSQQHDGMTRDLITKLKDALRDIIERREEVTRRAQTIEEAVIGRLSAVNRLQANVTDLTAANALLSQQLVDQKQQVVDANKMVRLGRESVCPSPGVCGCALPVPCFLL
jgi:hypothetical protein